MKIDQTIFGRKQPYQIRKELNPTEDNNQKQSKTITYQTRDNLLKVSHFVLQLIDAMPIRVASQSVVRKKHVKTIVTHMSARLTSKLDQDRMHTTNRLLPLGSMRRRPIKKIFGGWILSFKEKGRVFTQKLAGDVCSKLRKKFGLPGKSDRAEVLRMHLLLKVARKRNIGKPVARTRKAMSSMDVLQTIPLAFESDETCQDRYSDECSSYPILWS